MSRPGRDYTPRKFNKSTPNVDTSMPPPATGRKEIPKPQKKPEQSGEPRRQQRPQQRRDNRGGQRQQRPHSVEKMLHHSMMLHGLVSLSLMLEMASLQDLQKNHSSHVELVLKLQNRFSLVQESTLETEKKMLQREPSLVEQYSIE